MALYVALSPLWLVTAWPHDFMLLAFAQALALEALRRRSERPWALIALTATSIVASSWAFAAAFGWGRRPATLGTYAYAAIAVAIVLMSPPAGAQATRDTAGRV